MDVHIPKAAWPALARFDAERFRKIYERVCEQSGIPFDLAAYQHLVEKWYLKAERDFQAVHPRDILKIVQALCDYEKIPLQTRPDLMDEACESYFVETSA